VKALKLSLILSLLAIVLFGCDQEKWMEKFTPKEEVEYSKKYLALFQSRDFEAIAAPLNPELKTDQLQSQLEQVAKFFPLDKPKNIDLVGSQTLTNGDKWQGSITFQYEFPSSWLIASINLERFGQGELIVNGINVYPIQDSLETLNKFTLKEKSPVHYLFFVLAIIIPLFILFTFVTCLRTPIKKRKWLWAIFILFGFVQFTINWTSGAINFKPISFMLFGAGYFYANKFAPLMLSVAIPVGAVIFWLKRGKFIQDNKNEVGQPDTEVDAENRGGADAVEDEAHHPV